MTPLLSVRNLRIRLPRHGGGLVEIVHGIDLDVATGQTVGLVGESGSGKSMTTLAITRLLATGAEVTGNVWFEGEDLLAMTPRRLRHLLGRRIAVVFQDPMSALTPHVRVADQIAERLRWHFGQGRREARRVALEWLERVDFPNPGRRGNDYPHQLSGGMLQRVLLAMALCVRPALVVGDEPTSALDVTVQARLLDLLARCREEWGLAVLLVTHDLGLVARRADRVIVLYGGTILEAGPTEALLHSAVSPYTRALLRISLALLDGNDHLVPIPDEARFNSTLTGVELCPFLNRCPEATVRCREQYPPKRQAGAAHEFLCWEG